MLFRWRAVDGQTLYAGLEAMRFFQAILISITKKSYILVIFQGGEGSRPPVPPLDPRILRIQQWFGEAPYLHIGPI